jgi:hypothetical protein
VIRGHTFAAETRRGDPRSQRRRHARHGAGRCRAGDEAGQPNVIVNVTLSPHHGLPAMVHFSAARASVDGTVPTEGRQSPAKRYVRWPGRTDLRAEALADGTVSPVERWDARGPCRVPLAR